MIRLYSISLGCPKNRVDTERTLGRLAAPDDLLAVDAPEKADLVFINTCAFIGPAVEESVKVMMELAARVEGMPPKKRPLLVIAGCLVGRYGKKTLEPDLPEADLLLDASTLDDWPRAIVQALAGRARPGKAAAGQARGRAASAPSAPLSGAAPAAALPQGRLLSTGPAYAWLKVSEGCRHSCAFCTIPSIRGKLQSMALPVLKSEAERLLQAGVKELVLVAQDLTAWGADAGEERGLVSLLESLLPLPGLARLRLMYLYPAGLSRELLSFLRSAGSPFVPYFDVPLQHAAKNVLSRMGRPFAGNPRECVDRIREFFPEAALRTTFITGFPGESEQDFAELLAFTQETRFHHVGAFAYYAEEGTKAAAMPDQVPVPLREKRRDILMAAQREISAEILERYVGERMDILVDAPHEEWPGLHVGRAWFQAPEVDGVCYVSGPGVAPGALVSADVVESSDYDLVTLTDATED